LTSGFQKCLKASTKEEFDLARSELEGAHPTTATYMARLFERSEKWSHYSVHKKLTLGIQATQRAESMNSLIADWVSSKIALPTLFGRMMKLEKNQKERVEFLNWKVPFFFRMLTM
jgi:hypothetical protein